MNKLTEYDLQMAVMNYHSPFSGKSLIPNMSTGWGEADILMLSKAGYATEYEIKVSRSDFAADKNKVEKHEAFSKVYYNEPFVWWNNKPRNIKGIPNYFIYVVPDYFNIKTLKLPEYAGLWVIKDGRIVSDKIAPKIHKEKHKEFWLEKMARSFSRKYYYHYFKELPNSVETEK